MALDPHIGFYVARVVDALRVMKSVDRPNVGVTFNLAQCLLAKEDESYLDETFREALPDLRRDVVRHST